jgi:ribosome-associated translation inhibitor RaiA
MSRRVREAHPVQYSAVYTRRFICNPSRVPVQVDDVAGAQGTTDTSCRIRAELLTNRCVLSQQAVDANLYVAIDLATERVGRSLGRSLERNRRFVATREFHPSEST